MASCLLEPLRVLRCSAAVSLLAQSLSCQAQCVRRILGLLRFQGGFDDTQVVGHIISMIWMIYLIHTIERFTIATYRV